MLDDFEMLSGRLTINATNKVVTVTARNIIGQSAAILLSPAEARQFADSIHEALVTKERMQMEVKP